MLPSTLYPNVLAFSKNERPPLDVSTHFGTLSKNPISSCFKYLRFLSHKCSGDFRRSRLVMFSNVEWRPQFPCVSFVLYCIFQKKMVFEILLKENVFRILRVVFDTVGLIKASSKITLEYVENTCCCFGSVQISINFCSFFLGVRFFVF